ncbi:lysis protein [Candidatus Hamiltonella defensa]|uniref:lysis protein n=1 Tax=Candidatus Williamhamiltonella defendens TaxID=138072 RepID=UPI0015824944|nr:lysis protein [Candidatus Hamiltonella defensa]
MFAAVLYYRTQYQQAEQARQQFEKEVDAQQGVMKQLSQQIQAVSALDTKHSRELEHDKKLITQLEWDVAANRRRLRVKATCSNVSANTTSSSLDDAALTRFTDTAQRNYFTLRRRIEIAEEQINGLQDYIQQVVLSHQQEVKN